MWNTKELVYCYCGTNSKQYSTMVDIHGPLETRVEERCLGGVCVSCLVSRTQHGCQQHGKQVYIKAVLTIWKVSRPQNSKDILFLYTNNEIDEIGVIKSFTALDMFSPNGSNLITRYLVYKKKNTYEREIGEKSDIHWWQRVLSSSHPSQ